MTERSYLQLCGVARALDIVGNRWTLLIVRNLLVGPLRYSELLATLPGITTNLLADRLKHLEAHSIVEKVGVRPYAEYQLSERGEELRAVITGLGAWGQACPVPEGAIGNLRWGLLSLTRTRTPDFEDCSVVKESGGREFILCAKDEQIRIVARAPLPISVSIEGTGDAYLALFFGARSSGDLILSGDLAVEGNDSAQARWLRLLSPFGGRPPRPPQAD